MNQTSTTDRPRTAILIRHIGIGDLVWHLPFIRAIAARSEGGKVSVIAAPSTRAKDILAAEDCVEHVLYYDRNARRSERRHGAHRGFIGMWHFARELAQYRFGRIYLFSRRYHHAILAWLAGIPVRAGFGTNAVQRLFLNTKPFIEKYDGPGVAVFEEATRFMLAHGMVDARPVPKIKLLESDLAFGRDALAGLKRPVVCFAIGTSEVHKHWGDAKYGALADALLARGYSVVLLGGPGEEASAQRIVQAVSPERRQAVVVMTRNTIMQTAGVLRAADYCLGNDTGVLNMAATLDRKTVCLLGQRPLLLQDPLIHCIHDKPLDRIELADALAVVLEQLPPTPAAQPD